MLSDLAGAGELGKAAAGPQAFVKMPERRNRQTILVWSWPAGRLTRFSLAELVRYSLEEILLRNLILGGALVGVLSLALVGTTFATQTTMDTSLNVSPTKAGTKKNPRAAVMNLGIEGTSPSGMPGTTTRLKVTLPKGLQWNGKRWPSKKRCSPSKATAKKSASACPRGSKVGSGHVTAVAGNGSLVEEIDLTAFVTTRGNLGLFLKATSPVPLGVMLEGKVKGRTINVAIPTNIQEPVRGIPTGIKTLRFKLSGKAKIGGKSRGVIETTGCAGSWKAQVTNVLRDGTVTESASAKCRK
jgi:hypothetical protein